MRKAALEAAAETLRLLQIPDAEQWLRDGSHQFSEGKVRRVMPPGDGSRTGPDSTSIGVQNMLRVPLVEMSEAEFRWQSLGTAQSLY